MICLPFITINQELVNTSGRDGKASLESDSVIAFEQNKLYRWYLPKFEPEILNATQCDQMLK